MDRVIARVPLWLQPICVSIALYMNYRFNLGIHWVPNWISCTTNYQYQCKICRYLLHTTHLLNIAYWILIQIQSIKSASGSDSLHICHYSLYSIMLHHVMMSMTFLKQKNNIPVTCTKHLNFVATKMAN